MRWPNEVEARPRILQTRSGPTRPWVSQFHSCPTSAWPKLWSVLEVCCASLRVSLVSRDRTKSSNGVTPRAGASCQFVGSLSHCQKTSILFFKKCWWAGDGCLGCAGGHKWHRTALLYTCWAHSRWHLRSTKLAKSGQTYPTRAKIHGEIIKHISTSPCLEYIA